MQNLSGFMKKYAEMTDRQLEKYIAEIDAPGILKEAMGYSLQAGGKRIRPILTLSTLAAFKKDITIGIPVACAIEMIHTYSLIHDDLPAMDNDDFRRGKPTNHRVFGEANAILAGDALLTYGFQVLSEMNISLEKRITLINGLARASGPEGMVAGQAADLEGENKSLNIEQLEYIHRNKTGKLISFSVLAGAVLADAGQEITEKLEKFAYHIGMAFQIRDDILDIEGSVEKTGKPVGSDEKKQKSTYPQLLTLTGAKEKLNEHTQEALKILEELPLDTSKLQYVTELISRRDH